MALDGVCLVSPVDAHKLFHEVCTEVRGGPVLDKDDMNAIVDAHTKLVNELLTSVEEEIKAASQSGKRHVNIATFHGGEQYEGYSKLCLAIGPRDRVLRQDYRHLGVDPVLNQLRRHLFPFCVHHLWFPYTNENTIQVSW